MDALHDEVLLKPIVPSQNSLLDDKSAIYHAHINDDMKNNTRIDTVCFQCDDCVKDSCSRN